MSFVICCWRPDLMAVPLRGLPELTHGQAPRFKPPSLETMAHKEKALRGESRAFGSSREPLGSGLG
jgi:hypothetical protein